MRLPRGAVLVVASHNPGKVREIKALLGPHGIEPVSAGELGLPEPEETGLTFRANAELKARAAADAGHHPALADDSGLWRSMRWTARRESIRRAGPVRARIFPAPWRGWSANCVTSEPPDFSAKFVCALSLAMPRHNGNQGEMQTFEGEVHGTALFSAPRDPGLWL